MRREEVDQGERRPAARQLRGRGQGRGVAPAQVALAWLLAKPAVTSILIGANKMTQLEDNLRAAELQLSIEEVAALDEISAEPVPYPNWFTNRVQDPAVTAALKPAAS